MEKLCLHWKNTMLNSASMGFLVDEQTPMIWRGPMVISAIKTMTQKVLWRDRDVIIIDMPPGTGDTQLTFAQEVKVDGAIIVSNTARPCFIRC